MSLSNPLPRVRHIAATIVQAFLPEASASALQSRRGFHLLPHGCEAVVYLLPFVASRAK